MTDDNGLEPKRKARGQRAARLAFAQALYQHTCVKKDCTMPYFGFMWPVEPHIQAEHMCGEDPESVIQEVRNAAAGVDWLCITAVFDVQSSAMVYPAEA